MRRGNKPLLSFNAGEWSPRLAGRVDLAGAQSALRSCANFIVRPSGALRRRPGFLYVATVTPYIPPGSGSDVLLFQSQVVLEAFVPLDDQVFL